MLGDSAISLDPDLDLSVAEITIHDEDTSNPVPLMEITPLKGHGLDTDGHGKAYAELVTLQVDDNCTFTDGTEVAVIQGASTGIATFVWRILLYLFYHCL